MAKYQRAEQQEESTPIPDSGVTPDNVLDLIDGVAGLMTDEEPEKEERREEEDTGLDADLDQDADEESDQDADDEEPEDTDDEGEDEDEDETRLEKTKGWQDYELEGANKAKVPFQLKVDGDTRLYRFKAAEQTIEVDEAEMIAGYQRQQDYNRSKNELIQREDQLLPYANVVAYAQTDPQFVQHIQSYFQNGPSATVKDDLSITDEQIRAAMEDDPDEAAAMLTRRNKAQERARIDAQAQQQTQSQLAAWAQRQREVVMERFPDYDDVKDDLRDFLISEGFSDQEIEKQYDSRLFSLVYKAFQHDRSTSARRAPTKELKDKRRTATPPKIIKSGAGKQSKTTPAQQKRVKQQKGLFSKAMDTGTSDDWAAAIETLLPDDAI